jgi:hypothetical protein
MPVSKSDAQRLSKDAAEMGAHVLRGVLQVGQEGVKIGQTDAMDWLAPYAGTEVILIVTSIGQRMITNEQKICYTCGRDYRGDACPYCTEARARLRGN